MRQLYHVITTGIITVCNNLRNVCTKMTSLMYTFFCWRIQDEMNLPADIPSYLSSQGTLSEPQEGYSNSENGSHQQLMPSHANGYVHKGTDGNIMLCSFSKCLFLDKGYKIQQRSNLTAHLVSTRVIIMDVVMCFNRSMLW